MSQEEMKTVDFARSASLGLPGSIKQVADYLLSEGTGIEQLTMAQIASRTYTSKPTLVRFAKQAGYAGWRDFRRDFLVAMKELERQQAAEASVDVNHPFSSDASSEELVESILEIQRLAAEEVRRALDPKVLRQAAQALVDSREVLCLGVWQNYHRGRVFASRLSPIGILCRTPSGEEAATVARMLDGRDCAVVISYSGDLTHTPISFVPSLKEQGVRIIAVTNSQRSPLRDVADYSLSFAPLEHYHSKIGSFYSGTCTTIFLDALHASCYALRFDESQDGQRDVIAGLKGRIPDDFACSDDALSAYGP